MTPFLIGNLKSFGRGLTGTSPNTPLPNPLEESNFKDGWNIDKDNPKLARRYGGGWSKTVGVDEASLDYLDKIESHLDKIRFRVGFMALALVLFLIFGLTLTEL